MTRLKLKVTRLKKSNSAGRVTGEIIKLLVCGKLSLANITTFICKIVTKKAIFLSIFFHHSKICEKSPVTRPRRIRGTTPNSMKTLSHCKLLPDPARLGIRALQSHRQIQTLDLCVSALESRGGGGGSTGAKSSPIFWMEGGSSVVIALMTSSLLKDGPTNIFSWLPPCLRGY